MAEAQEKRPTQDDGWNLGDRLTAALGREARNCGYPFSSWMLPFEDLRALLDKLDEAKAERDEAIDARAEALSEQARAEAARDEARGSIARLAGEVAQLTGRSASRQAMQNDLAWVPVEVERLLREVKLNEDLRDRAERERDEARAEVGRLRSAIDHADANASDWRQAESEQRKEVRKRDARIANLEAEVERLQGIIAKAAEHVVQCDSLPPWEGGLDAGVGAMRQRVAELEAEVERLRKERTDAQRTAVDEAQAANKAIGRVAELEKAARAVVHAYSNSHALSPEPGRTIRRLDRLLRPGNPDDVDFDEPTNGVVEMPLPDLEESGDQPTPNLAALRRDLDLAVLIRDLDKLIAAELGTVRDRLARLEASNG